ncbi:adenine phosphoribosyltransferase [Candidatus Microgenomates bacterium]|nr:adenine phosphoribosyltransferase [Candidatus Microgenomates bacterium]
MNYYTLKIGNITRKLPIVFLRNNLRIASVNLLGDTELVEIIAKKLLNKLKQIDFDYFVGPEVKVVPLLHELSRLSKNNRYVVCRKNIHGYMVSPIKTNLKSPLVINGSDAELLKGKRVVIVDDVVTTGSTFYSVEKLMELVNTKVVAKIAVFKQGDNLHPSNKNTIFISSLPTFTS